MLLDIENTKYYQGSQQAFNTKGEYRISSEQSLQLLAKAQQHQFANEIEQLKTIYSFLNLNDGQEEIFNIMELMVNKAGKSSGRSQDLKVLHCSKIAIALREKAVMLKKASGMQMYNTQFAKKEDRLREVAKIQIRSG